jgi:hypothetical protein
MKERVPDDSRGEEGDFCRALLQIRAVALRGLAKANTELTTADEEKDPEGWALWRGYRKAMLEILAITDKLPLPPGDASPTDTTNIPAGGKSHGAQTA